MATKEYININNLRAVPEGSSSYKTAKAVYKGNTKIYRACKGSIVVWDVWRAALTGSMAKVNPSGGSVLNYLTASSYYTDYAGTNHNLGYSVSPTSIAANKSSSQVTGSIVITLNTTGLQTLVSYTQEADSIKDVTLGSPSITSLSVGDVGADGSGTSVFVYWERTKTTEYNSGKKEEETITGSCDATGISGTSYNSGYTSGGTIYGSDRGTVTGSRRYCYYITSVTFSINGTSFTASFTKYVYQEANTYSTYYSDYSLTLSSPSNSIDSAGNSISINCNCTRKATKSYTSGSEELATEGVRCSLSTNHGSINPTSITGSGSATLTAGENTSSSRNVIVTATSSAGSLTKTLTIPQDGVSYVFSSESGDSISVPYTGGYAYWDIISSRNGVNGISLNSSNFSVSGDASVTYSGIEESGEGPGYYQVIFDVGNNTSVTSLKVSTVTATQPGSGKKMSIQIYVATKPSAPAYDLTYTNTDIVTGSISTKFTFRIDNTYSTSKTISKLYIVYWSGGQANISLVEDVISAWEMGNPPVQSMMVTSGGKTWANYSNIINTYMNANGGSNVIAAYGSVEFTRTEGISKDDFGSFVNNGVAGVILYRDSVNGYGYQEF